MQISQSIVFNELEHIERDFQICVSVPSQEQIRERDVCEFSNFRQIHESLAKGS